MPQTEHQDLFTPPRTPAAKKIEFIARGLIQSNGRVLMCQNIKHGHLYLPGGHIEIDEPARAALEREMLEECGLACKAGPLLLTTEQVFEQRGKPRHEVSLVFHVEHLGDGPPGTTPEEIPSLEDKIAFVWIDLAAALDAPIQPESIKAWLISGGGVDPSQGPFIAAD